MSSHTLNNSLRKVKLVLNGSINSLIFKLAHPSGFDLRKTIVVFGSIRSGSTWLAEVLSSQEGHLQIFEPLHPDYVPEAKKSLPDQRPPYVSAKQEWPAGIKLFERILSGKVINSWIMSQASLNKILTAKRLVVKFVRGNLLLEWIITNMDILTPILVIRHPCAIVASHLSKGWPPGKRRLLDNPYLNGYPDIKKQCEDLSEPEELAALAWCLRYHAPLMVAKPYPFILVSYERLVRNGQQELERIFGALNIPFDDRAISQLSIPSDTATNSSQIVAGKDSLAGWKHKLTDQQVENILAVLEIFEMNFYSSELEPDFQRLSEFGQ